MKIVITGASGYLGRQLVPLLESNGHEILLVGRNLERLASLFPNARNCSYDDIYRCAIGSDILIHLAVLNNTAQASIDEFRKVNVNFFLSVVEAAKKSGIKRLLNVTTFHVLDENATSSYAQSKREAISSVISVTGISIVHILLPAVYGNRYAGKLSLLNRFPNSVSNIIFPFVSALAPTVNIRRLSDFINEKSLSVGSEEPVLLFDPKIENGSFRFLKRAIDLLFASTIVGFFWWGLIIIWLLVKFDSPGGGIFSQARVGRNGKIFKCFKFRTMKQGTAQAGTHEVSSTSVTKVGAFLRKTKIDELPQIWNIFRGELSLVGPRPSLPIQTDLNNARQKLGVHAITPGITGLAQVNGIDMSQPELLAQWDARYIARQSLILDMKIIVATFTGSGQGDLVAAA